MRRSLIGLLFAGGLTVAGLAFATGKPAEDSPIDQLMAQIKQKVGEDKPYTLFVHAKVKPGTEKQLEESAAIAVVGTRKEPGNIAYEIHRNVNEPGTYTLFEKWKNLSAMQTHFGHEHTQQILKTFGEIAAAPLKIELHVPVMESK